MNYFAHGMRFTDRPYFLAGTACPDWLSVADRRVRLRARRVQPFADDSGSIEAEVAAGVLQHLADDNWFHQTRAFVETSAILTRMIRGVLGPEDGFRPGFLGHIVTELILDGVLIQQRLRMAVLEGRPVRIGDTVDGCVLKKIAGYRAEFECHDGPAVLKVRDIDTYRPG